MQQALERAIQLHRSGQLAEAERAYRNVLASEPRHPDALHMLGLLLYQTGRPDEAVLSIRSAIAAAPQAAPFHSNLGLILTGQGKLKEAIAAHRQAIGLNPNYPQAHNNLGSALLMNRRFDEALAAFERAAELNPAYAEAHYNIGVTRQRMGQYDDAIAAYQRAQSIHPDNPATLNALGAALCDARRIDESIEVLHKVLSIKPAFAEAWSNLGRALKARGELDEAIAAFRKALAIQPRLPEVLNNLGNALAAIGQMDEAIACQRRSLEVRPDAAVASNVLFSLLFQPGLDRQAVYEEHARWNQTYAAPLAPLIRPYANDRNPDRRLRIGYLSPDFRQHAVGYNVIGLIRNHDRAQFEVYCYSNVGVPDSMMETFRSYSHAWRDIRGLTDEQVAQQVRADRIDILIDLALHTSGNRLLVFAQKPAPVQVTFAGYPGTTGLTAIDYRLSDPYLDPPCTGDEFSSEQVIRLPDSFWCYDPLSDEPAVGYLRALEAGFVTFGCLCKFAKVNPQVLSLWARVLNTVPSSRMLISAPMGSARRCTLEILTGHGVDSSRVEFVDHQPREAYLRTFGRIDIGLDTFPYNGHTTSLDSFWMGVPVVTLVGDTPVARAGWCQLSNLGLTELAGKNSDEFVQIAERMAGDLPRLAALRGQLRQRMRASPLMDAVQYARNVELEYRRMWRIWCESAANR